MRHIRKTALLAIGASVALALSGCGMLPGQPQATSEAAPETGQEDLGQGGPALPILAQSVGATIHHDGVEYTVESMEVIDLDAEADRSTRMQGVELTFTGTVVNPMAESRNVSSMVMLQWQDPEGHSHQASGRIDDNSVPGGNASAPIAFEVTLTPDQLDTFDQDTAVLLFGREGHSRSQIPLGDGGELITRIPVEQTGIVGQSFDVDGMVTVTVDEAELRWDVFGGVEDGQAVLEISVTKQNDTNDQVCWERGEANNFTLVSATGAGTGDLSMSDRGCAAPGQSHSSFTGIPVHEPFAGDYTLTLHYSYTDWDRSDGPTIEVVVPMEFTMLEEPAVLLSQR